MCLSTIKQRLLAFVLGLGACTLASAQDNEALIFSLSSELGTGASLAVELDGYDVTAFASLDGTQLSLALDIPLTPGDHTVLALAFAPNGEIYTLLDHPLNIAASESQQSQQQSAWNANATLATNYRVYGSPELDYQELSKLAGQGALALRGRSQRGAVQLSAEVDALYDSVSENLGNGTGTEVALPNYRIDAQYNGDAVQSGATVGNIRVDQESLLFSMFQRRGTEIRMGTASQTTEVRLFEVNSDPITRVDRDLILPAEEQRGSGATFKTQLAGEKLGLNLGYVEGQTFVGGGGIYLQGDPVLYGGDSWNMGLDSRWLNHAIWFHLEYAESEFDNDGIHQGEAAEKDSALQLMAQFQSGGLPSGPFDYWSATLQHQAIGARYYSLGNLFLPGDLTSNRIVGQFGKQSVSVGLEWSNEVNNLEDDIHRPTQTLDHKLLTLNYSPMGLDPQQGLWRFVGSPMVMLSLAQTEHSQPDADAQLVGFDLDRQTDDVGINLTFTQNTWNWGLQWQETRMDDRAKEVIIGDYLMNAAGADTHNRMLGLQAGWMPSARTNVNLFMQWNRQTQVDAGDIYYNRNIGFDTYTQLIPNRLILAFNYNYGADRSRLANPYFKDDDSLNHFGNVQLTWSALDPVGNTPGINVYLRSSYGRQDNFAYALSQEQWSAHVGIEFAWSAGEM